MGTLLMILLWTWLILLIGTVLFVSAVLAVIGFTFLSALFSRY